MTEHSERMMRLLKELLFSKNRIYRNPLNPALDQAVTPYAEKEGGKLPVR